VRQGYGRLFVKRPMAGRQRLGTQFLPQLH
jgi:hypothetical protein